MVHYVSGGVSRSIAGTLLMPATVIKIRFESGLYAYSGILSAFSNLIRYFLYVPTGAFCTL
jgi:solute carrier family 25 protein 38